MPAKQNAKAVAGRARKEENENKKKAAVQAVKDAAEDADWAKGAKGKGKGEDKAAKAEADKARKAEAARLLALEEASMPSKPKVKEAAPKKKPAAAPAKAAPAKIPSFEDGLENDEPTSFSGTGLDAALEMMTLVNEKSDKASMGAKAATIEQHPERRFKAAFEAYKEAELPNIRKDFPGLRLQQYHDRLYKDFQKSPLNPFNQQTLAYNSTKGEKLDALKASRAEMAERHRTD
ncbi:DUF1014-domain-containing protein [Pseudohyphozyma bogoriensis]|nr:DUF1014-domain-containing protein [Pseudohyphozyma bogoriensis]